MTGYVPPTYKFFTFHIYFHTQTPPSTFEPISPQQVTTPNTKNQTTESSPQSSLPCGQQTPTSSTNTSDTPSQDTPPQPFVHSQPQPHTPTQTHHTSPKPHKPQDIQHSPVKTNINPPTQSSIPDEETQRVSKSMNGNQVKPLFLLQPAGSSKKKLS